MTLARPTNLLPLLLILLAAVFVRVPLALDYAPVSYPDTGTYFAAARDLARGDAAEAEGRRTPGYPLVVALAGADPQTIVIIQVVAGVASSLLLGWLVVTLTGSATWAVVAGLSHAWSMQQLLQEGVLLTEAISAFCVILTLSLLIGGLALMAAQRQWLAMLLAASAAGAYAIFVRPQFLGFVILLPLVVLYALHRRGEPGLRSVGLTALVAAPAVALLLAWGAFQHSRTGYFTMSTQPAFGLVNHTIDYIELARDEWAVPRRILLETRERRIREVGHARNGIWYALPELQRTMGWTLPQANVAMQAMCRQMFIDHPWLYARSVASAWVDFWTVPFFWKPEQVNPAVRSAVEGIWWVQHKLLRLANLAFVLVVAAACVSAAFRRRVHWDVALTAISATILMSSLIQALADQGASSRYHLPTQSLVVLVLVVAAARWRGDRTVTAGSASAISPERGVRDA